MLRHRACRSMQTFKGAAPVVGWVDKSHDRPPEWCSLGARPSVSIFQARNGGYQSLAVLFSIISAAANCLAQRPDSSSQCGTSTFAVSPDLAMTYATTKEQVISGSANALVNKADKPGCGQPNRFQVLTASKYDLKQKDGAAATITRHNVGTIRDLVPVTGTRYGVSLSASLLADNSLGLYLQQSYSLAIAATLTRGDFSSEASLGAALIGQHFSAAVPSTRFGAPTVSLTFDYTTPVDTSRKGSRPTELTFSTWDALSRTRVSNSQAALAIPTMLAPLSVLVKTSLDYISNPPPKLKNHYITLDIGPKITIGSL